VEEGGDLKCGDTDDKPASFLHSQGVFHTHKGKIVQLDVALSCIPSYIIDRVLLTQPLRSRPLSLERRQ
jgi:hypothetical protein